MERYLGVDAHAQSCTLVVMSATGQHLRSLVVETNGEALVRAVQGIGGHVHVCLEEGTQSAWLYELLKPHVAEITVSMPPEKRGAKSDERDAWTRANELRTGRIETRVYKAPAQLAALRCAVRAYDFAVTDLARAKNRLKSVFLSRGVRTESGVYDPERRAEWLKQLTAPYQGLARWIGREIDQLLPLREEAEVQLAEEGKRHPIIRKLSTVPGMGPIRSAHVVAIGGTPERFRTKRQFWSYAGLGIITRTSAEWGQERGGEWVRAPKVQTRGLSRRRQPRLKAVFKGAATTVISQLPKDPLHADYQRTLRSGTKPPLARLTLARRIAAIVLSMWRHQEVYNPKRHRLAVSKP